MGWFIVVFGLTLGNVVAKLLFNYDWGVFFERSFFQWLAVLIVYFNKPWL